MKTRIIILISLINLLFIPTAQASLEVNPVYPTGEPIIGTRADYYSEEWKPYAALVYSFGTEDIHYNLGSEYQINPQLSIDGQYNKWFNYNLPGYMREEGVKANLDYNRTWGEDLNLAIFAGEIKDEDKEIETIYVNCNYQRELYYAWDREVNLVFDITSGQIDGEDDIYYTSNLKLPVKLGDYSILPEVGYIESSDKIKPRYQLEDYLPGHSKEKEGSKLMNLNLARRFDFLAHSGLRGVEMMDVITSVNIGDILAADEGLKDLSLNAAAGVGLSYEMAEVDFRLKSTVDDQGEYALVFNVANNY